MDDPTSSSGPQLPAASGIFTVVSVLGADLLEPELYAGAHHIERHADVTLLWYAGPARAVSAARRVVTARPDCYRAAVACGELEGGAGRVHLMETSAAMASLAEVGEVYLDLATVELARSQFAE